MKSKIPHKNHQGNFLFVNAKILKLDKSTLLTSAKLLILLIAN